jgi:hypothetical protein
MEKIKTKGQVPRENEMGLLGKLLGAAVDVVLTPIEIVKDVATMGGALTDKEGGTYTTDRLSKAIDKVSQAADDAADGDLI